MRGVARTQQELSGMGTEGAGRRRQPEFKRHWGGGAGLTATKLGLVRPWELIRSSTPTPRSPRLFCPFLANHPKEMNKLHPFGIFPPALNYHKQMQRGLNNWSELHFGVLSGSGGTFLLFPRGVLASGTEPKMGIAAKTHNGGFHRVRFHC